MFLTSYLHSYSLAARLLLPLQLLLFHTDLVSGEAEGVLYVKERLSTRAYPKETKEKWSSVNSVSHSEREQQLIDVLFRDYSRKQKPPGTVDVKFALNLNSIVNIIEKEQIFVLNAFIDHEWTDTRIQWDPAEYGNITILRVGSEKIWT